MFKWRTSQRDVGASNVFAGEVIVATVWLLMYVGMLASVIGSEVFWRATEFATAQ